MFVKNEIYDFCSLEYNCWSGALDTLNRIREADKEDEFMYYLENVIFCDEIPTMTEVNDFIWFEDETIFEDLGIKEEDEDYDDDYWDNEWDDEEEEDEEDE